MNVSTTRRTRSRITLATLAAGALVALPVVAAQADASAAFQNGSFEFGSYNSTAPFDTLTAGTNADAMTGWTVTAGNVDWVGNYWHAPDGARSVDMNGTASAGTISQTFATVAGATYAVQYQLATNDNPGCDTTASHAVTVAAAGASETFSSTVSAYGTTPWDTHMLSFQATGPSTTLTVAGDPNNTTNCGGVVDAVTVTRVLASGADCKDGGWMSLATADGVTFRNQGQCVSYYATSGQTPIRS